MQEAAEIDIIPFIKTDHSVVILNKLPKASSKEGLHIGNLITHFYPKNLMLS